MVVYILPYWDYFAIQTPLFIYKVECSINLNIVEWLVSMPAVRLFAGSALTIFFGLACRGYTFDRRAFNILFQKV